MLIMGGCLEELKKLPDNSIDSLVTDPPAGISFMGKEWDKDLGGRIHWIGWMTLVMSECLRVLKPGGHGLVWAIPRTSHWTATALEEAGFEIRDQICHLFGSGFPKSLDISKAIDKLNNHVRPVIGLMAKPRSNINATNSLGGAFQKHPNITSAASAASAAWQGYGTALKPAHEIWILIRKPISEKTVAANVLKWGCGGLNIDGSRISTKDNLNGGTYSYGTYSYGTSQVPGNHIDKPFIQPTGRFPSNLVLSHNDDCVEVGTKKVGAKTKPKKSDERVENDNLVYGKGLGVHTPENSYGIETVTAWECTPGCAVAMLDRQSGTLKSGASKSSYIVKGCEQNSMNGKNYERRMQNRDADSGGASRFFYCAKASKSDKGADNTHPTVKSTKLMSYLTKLITPPNGIVLDPFMGSGSTGVAALREGFQFIGIEQEKEYFEIAEKRINHTKVV